MGKNDEGTPRGKRRHPGEAPEETGANQPGKPGLKPGAKPDETLEQRGYFDTAEAGYQLTSRSEQHYPEAYRPVNEEFWHGIKPDQADAVVKLQAIAMEKVGFEKGTPKFFIEDDAGSAYAADEYFVGPERARVAAPKSVIGMTDAEIAYLNARQEKARWLKERKNKRRRAIQRESEADGGMNFLPATRAELMEAEALISTMARQSSVPDVDGPALLIGGALMGAGLFLGYMGLLPVFAEDYTVIIAKVLPIIGLCTSAFGVVVLFNHMRS